MWNFSSLININGGAPFLGSLCQAAQLLTCHWIPSGVSLTGDQTECGWISPRIGNVFHIRFTQCPGSRAIT